MTLPHHTLRPTLRPLLLAAALQAAVAQAQMAQPQPVIDEHPLPATVHDGEGVLFSVKARAVGGGFITRIEWRDGLGRLVQAGVSPILRRAAWTTADAGDYTATVVHSTGISATSRPARLTVLTKGWAPLGGRAFTLQASARPPALELCDVPMVAWVENTPAGNREMRVHRFDGVQWLPMDARSMLARPTNSPNEPSLQCSRSSGRGVPVLAFSEGWAGGGQISVKRWDGLQWVQDAAVNANPGAVPRAPVLRVPPPDAGQPISGDPPLGSWLAWQEGTGLAAARRDEGGWTGVAGGRLPGSTFGPPVLAIDTATRTQQGLVRAPLLAAIDVGADGSLPRPMQRVPALSWTGLGGPPAAPVRNGLRAVGLGFTTENSAPRAVMVWTEGGSNFTLRSATLFNTDYGNAITMPYPSLAWGYFVDDLTGKNLRATAFDPQPFDVTCHGVGPDSFTVALSVSGGVDVVMSKCLGQTRSWVPVATRLNTDAAHLALKMAGHDRPLVATVGASGFGSYAVTVWKYRP